jgi:hypothetical protein
MTLFATVTRGQHTTALRIRHFLSPVRAGCDRVYVTVIAAEIVDNLAGGADRSGATDRRAPTGDTPD